MKKLIMIVMIFMMGATSFGKDVYVKARGNGGHKYHIYRRCRKLRDHRVVRRIPLRRAKRQGKRVCRVCRRRHENRW